MLYYFYGALFSAPGMIFPKHKHWELSENENAVLADFSDAAIKASPAARKNPLVRLILRHLPLITLIAMLAGILGSRIEASYGILRQSRPRKSEGTGESAGDSGGAGDPAGAGPSTGNGLYERGATVSPNGARLRALAEVPFQ